MICRVTNEVLLQAKPYEFYMLNLAQEVEV
jgi:hypothetical protein